MLSSFFMQKLQESGYESIVRWYHAKEGIPQQINGHDCGVFLLQVCVCVCVYNTCILTVHVYSMLISAAIQKASIVTTGCAE